MSDKVETPEVKAPVVGTPQVPVVDKDPAAVVETPPAPVSEVTQVLKIVNPNLTVEINIPGCDPYHKTGLRAGLMKTARAWIRDRGLSITMPDVVIADKEGAGDYVGEGDAAVKADLKVITFSKDCIAKSGRTVSMPKPRGRKADKPVTVADVKPQGNVPVAPVVPAVQPVTVTDAKGPADIKKGAAKEQTQSQPKDW